MSFGNSKLDTLNKYAAGIHGFIETTAPTVNVKGNFQYCMKLKQGSK